ncbi:MAG: DUF1538 domain-containing protein [Oscillospiraceae bacterium]
MNKKLKEKVLESFSSVLPITIIVFILSVTIVPMETGTIMLFLFGAILLIVGMGIFQLGAETAMIPMGEAMGAQFSKTKKLWIVLLLSFVMGVVITIAEPDLQVLANQVPSIPNGTLIAAVAVGVGVFLALAMLRVLLKVKLSTVLIVFYILLFGVSFFVPGDFLSVAFDSGGVTTGPITVPFIMAMGLGLASIRGDKDASDDSFGFVAISSIGPIMAVLILGIFFRPTEASYVPVDPSSVTAMQDVMRAFLEGLPHYAVEVLVAVAPILGVFLLFQVFTRKFTKRLVLRMLIGYGYTYIGLVLFLTGANVGFAPVGQMIGSGLANFQYSWILIPIGMVIGYFIVSAEPAVHVLNNQVEEVTEGGISHKSMNLCLSIGVAVSVALAMIRVLTGISIYWLLIPGYAIALILTFFVPKIFVGIAFDSGGVASGPMTSTFLLPFAMGACEALGGNVMRDAFGVVAMVAMTPLIAIQIMGLVNVIKQKKRGVLAADAASLAALEADNDIIEFDDDDDETESQGEPN